MYPIVHTVQERPLLSRQSSLLREGRSVSRTSYRRSSTAGSPAPRFSSNNSAEKALASGPGCPKGNGTNGLVESSFRTAVIKKWNGIERTTSYWDGLRRDDELWDERGDCIIHFYGRGQSRRGPSLRVDFEAIRLSNCRPLLEQFCFRGNSTSFQPSESTNVPDGACAWQIYIPSPPNCSREESFAYHVTTRNFFAWMFGQPLVGDHLGSASVALLDRMNVFRESGSSGQNAGDMMTYLEEQGYTDFRECPDHALGMLYFAEQFKDQSLWTDAFAHCVGMNNSLAKSSELGIISRVSKALITRAHLEMDLRLDHAGRILSSFLEDELSGAFLGLENGARMHLDRFRSFLHGYYVGKYGYWPPPSSQGSKDTLSKSTYRSMYFEFRNLYEYLVDEESTSSIQDNRPADGGLCVLQNINAFDRRHKYVSLPHPLPLVPKAISNPPVQQQIKGSFRAFKRNWTSFSKQSKVERRIASLSALRGATNSYNMMVMEDPLVHAYMRFEKTCTMKEEEKVSNADARKVRWILIYTILQTLISVTRAPKEVRDTEGLSYPLCCQVAGTPPWQIGVPRTALEPTPIADGSPTCKPAIKLDIRPDVDYFSDQPKDISRTPSIKSPQPRKPSWSEVLMHGYGNGANPAEIVSGQDPPSPLSLESSKWSGDKSSDGTDDTSLPEMDHTSITGSISIYGDDDDGTRVDSAISLGSCPAPGDTACGIAPHVPSVHVRREYSTDSFRLMNEDVERYVMA
ncbi:MAG: hypothetical protein M1835_000821 [Candelina submexicana]|nr:MAG: hypothetical protein M1835_000821 [Candelina submexicana]